MHHKKKTGRPSKDPDGKPRPSISIRIRDQTRARLVKAAEDSGRSLGGEIEFRLERSLDVPAFALDLSFDLVTLSERVATLIHQRLKESK
jgi:hypothetical protein